MAKKLSSLLQFVILPARGLQAHAAQLNFFTGLDSHRSASMAAFGATALPRPKVRVLDSIHEDKAKLVEMSATAAMAMRTQQPGVRIVPVTYYRPALAPRPTASKSIKSAATAVSTKLKLKFVSKSDDKPIAKVFVVAFTDFANEIGAQGTTNAAGEVSLKLGATSRKIERLYVYPQVGFWGLFRKNLKLTSGQSFQLQPLAFPTHDVLEHFYGTSAATDGQGVTVAVVDTGVGPHPDVTVAGGENTVLGELASDFGDNGDGHGTHVAGTIASHGKTPTGRSGVAPGVKLLSFRVFGRGADGASNFAIAKAIDRAVESGADLINMSLGGGDEDEAITSAIADARTQGVAVIIAAGNDGRQPVSFPGSDARAVAVSALGRKGAFPTNSVETADIAKPFGSDPKNFIAAFSNIGPEIDVTSTGVGIVSTFPGGYAALSGTSMACPAVTGFAAKVLSQHPTLLQAARDQARSDGIVQLVLSAAKSLGFGPTLEGRGLPK